MYDPQKNLDAAKKHNKRAKHAILFFGLILLVCLTASMYLMSNVGTELIKRYQNSADTVITNHNGKMDTVITQHKRTF